MSQTYNIYIGFDPKEEVAYEVLKWNLERIAKNPLNIYPLKKSILEKIGLYNREYTEENGQKIDKIDSKPFSSDFSFTRFLVPALSMYKGWALYMDCDMYPRSDICELFEEYNDPFHALYCVKHEYTPEDDTKMDNQKQELYYRKNWSSLMLFNCEHPQNQMLTPNVVNTQTGQYLHKFGWLPDKPADIGSIHEEWNWLDGHSPEELEAKNVHFTTGGPWFYNWKCKREMDGKYAAEWNNDAVYMQTIGVLKDEVHKYFL